METTLAPEKKIVRLSDRVAVTLTVAQWRFLRRMLENNIDYTRKHGGLAQPEFDALERDLQRELIARGV